MKRAVVFGPQNIAVADDTVQRWLLPVARGSEIVYIGVTPATSNSLSPTSLRFALILNEDLVFGRRYEIQFPHKGSPIAGTTGGLILAAIWIGRFRVPDIEEWVLEILIHNITGADGSWSAVVILELEDDR